MEIQLTYGKRRFNVGVELMERKRLSITVHPDLKISAKAPNQYSIELIASRLQKRAPWIARQVDFFDQYHPRQPERRYVNGETHFYLGRQYRLKVISANKSRVRLIGKYFYVEAQEKEDRDKIRFNMQKWYSEHAKRLLQKHLELHLPALIRFGAKKPDVIFRRMKKRWGSCSKNGTIVLNTELIKAPLFCIDYVIVHELCHLIYSNHDKNYYRLLTHILPDWEKRKERLEFVNL